MTDWQQRLDKRFPWGCLVTAVEDVPEGASADSTAFTVPRLVVLEDGEQPLVQGQIFEMQKDVVFRIAKMEEYSPGVDLVHTDEDRLYMLSTNVGEEVKAALKEARAEDYGEDV